MTVKLKPISDQVIVITGASSGIGLSTARLAVARGARVVLVSRNEDALQQLESTMREAGHQATHIAADVGDEGQISEVVRAAVERYGRIDTWINNAGISIFGRMTEISTADHRRLFETNFWGVVYGSLAAARYFRDHQRSGVLMNVGSVLSDRAIPIQGMYCASKFAVKGFTDALRMELEEEGIPISVTLVKPSSTDTPFTQHARNYMDKEPTLPPPVYDPDVVAKVILHCCEVPEREVTVGGGGKSLTMMGQYLPRTTDRVMEAVMPRAQRSGEAPIDPDGALYRPTWPLQEQGRYRGHVLGSSLYTTMALHPGTTLLALGTGLAVATLIGLGSKGQRE